VRSDGVVVPPPSPDEHFRHEETVEDLPPEQLILQFAVEVIDVAVHKLTVTAR
jgi:hypothetical protein